MKDKKVLIGIVIFLLVAGASYFLFFSGSKQKQIVTSTQSQDEVVPTIVPTDLGITFDLRDDKKAAKFSIAKSDDIQKIEYQLSYMKEVNGETVPEGLIGEVKEKKDGKFAIGYREFGTCSSGKCRYDKVVSPIKLTLKIIKTDGRTYSSETSVSL